MQPVAEGVAGLTERLVSFRFPGGIRVDADRFGVVASSLRHAVMQRVPDPLPPEVSGHGAQDRPHVAYLPLPDVGHAHARGDITGVAVLCPADRTDLGRVIHRALTSSPAFELQFSGASLRLRAESEVGSTARALVGPARTWATTAPLVLDRFPGKGNEGAEIRRACVRSGFPEPDEVGTASDSFLRGGIRLRRNDFPRREQPPRPFCHVRLRFPEPVHGPVLLGAQRYFGMGLFIPADT
ncbi:type I-U CRISPR-associated protein Cas5/Cas6 [Saccharopolyspora sp. HNM0983]|uniref:Type I-U CRISPR-associated protein Cas5/Cas6 n=1 Tax=Saccharopolyspora montiporae TaxID=2781240 RepID=A0A929BCW5_9PSEU|nr:type I-U CRISPR-associated protein Cas5/Cas6 [Saccharopolyspora sp. HNM0983]